MHADPVVSWRRNLRANLSLRYIWAATAQDARFRSDDSGSLPDMQTGRFQNLRMWT